MKHRIESHMTSVNEMARRDGVHLVNNVPFRPRPEASGRVISDEITEDMVMSFDGAVGFALVEPTEPYAVVKALDPAIPLHITSDGARGGRTQRLEADLSGMFRDDGDASVPANDDDADEPDGKGNDADAVPVEPAAISLPPHEDEAKPIAAVLLEALDLTEEGNAHTVEELREHMSGLTVKVLKELADDLGLELGSARAKAAIIERIVTAP